MLATTGQTTYFTNSTNRSLKDFRPMEFPKSKKPIFHATSPNFLRQFSVFSLWRMHISSSQPDCELASQNSWETRRCARSIVKTEAVSSLGNDDCESRPVQALKRWLWATRARLDSFSSVAQTPLECFTSRRSVRWSVCWNVHFSTNFDPWLESRMEMSAVVGSLCVQFLGRFSDFALNPSDKLPPDLFLQISRAGVDAGCLHFTQIRLRWRPLSSPDLSVLINEAEKKQA